MTTKVHLTEGQLVTAPTQKAGFRASQTHLCKPKVQFSERSFVVKIPPFGLLQTVGGNITEMP